MFSKRIKQDELQSGTSREERMYFTLINLNHTRIVCQPILLSITVYGDKYHVTILFIC
jgi:hypothetical protein